MAKSENSAPFRFNVSDAVEVPLRGCLLRLRLLQGEPQVSQLAPGTRLRLHAPAGEQRTVTIRARSLTGGRNTQERLEYAGLYDVIIDREDAFADPPVATGWTAEGPVTS